MSRLSSCSFIRQFERHSREDASEEAVNLDFDARVPIPFSVFPSSYRSDAVSAETTQFPRVDQDAKVDRTSRVEREDTRYQSAPFQQPPPRVYGKEEFDLHRHRPVPAQQQNYYQYQSEDRYCPPQTYPEVDINRERYVIFIMSCVVDAQSVTRVLLCCSVLFTVLYGTIQRVFP